MKKRIVSTLLALCMCLSLLPTAALAEGKNGGSTETHIHCVCGAEHTAIGNHTGKDEVAFAAWKDEDALPTEAGSYYLTCDVELSGTWTVSADITLCLNGHSITTTSSSVAIRINSDDTLTVTDCANTPGKITRASGATGRGVDNAGAFNLYNGEISGHSDNSTYGSAYGSAVYSNGCFNMYGGTISNCTGYYPLTMDVGDKGTIYGGNINVETFTTGTIAGGTFTLVADQQVEISRYEATGSNQSNNNWGIVTGGTFNGKVVNEGTIKGGTFNGTVTNNFALEDGTFHGTVTNNYDVNGGTFSGTVINNADGYINDGTFNGTVTNKGNGEIHGGTFFGTVTNERNGVIRDSAYKTVTFHTISSSTTQKILCGQKVTQPTNPDVSTWYTGEGLKVYSFDTPVTQNVDIYSLQALQAICPHTNINTETSYCPDCGQQMKVLAKNTHNETSKYFPTLHSAVGGYDSFMLLADCDETLEFSVGQTVFVDLNGQELTKLVASDSDGNTTVTDSAGGGRIGTLDAAGSTKISGGSYGTITGAGYVSLLDGYALEKSGGSKYKRSEITGTLENVKVVPCTDHSAVGGKCEYCNSDFGVEAVSGSGEDPTTVYYTDLMTALENAPNGATLKLLKDYSAWPLAGSSSGYVIRMENRTLTIDLNGKTVTNAEPRTKKSLYLSGGNWTFTGSGTWNVQMSATSTSSLTLKGSAKYPNTIQVGGSITVQDTVQVEKLGLENNDWNAAISGGSFGAFELRNNSTRHLGDALAEGYGFKTGDGKWYDRSCAETSLSNVSVGVLPSFAVSATGGGSCIYGNTITLTATDVTGASYQWYTVSDDNTETIINGATSAAYSSANLSVGEHTFRVKVTVDGYTKSAEASVTITKATLGEGFYPEPSAKTGLTYSGSPQTLVSGLEDRDGWTYEGWKADMGAKLMFRVDNGAWSDALPTATNAGTYNVCWYIDGGTNYESIGSKDEPKSIEVTIARKTVEQPYIVFGNNDQTSYTYTGSPIKPAFTLKDGNTVIPESEYTVSYYDNTNVCNNAQVTVACTNGGNYNFVAVTRTFEITRAAAPTLTGTKAYEVVYSDTTPHYISISDFTGLTGWPTDIQNAHISTFGHDTDKNDIGNAEYVADGDRVKFALNSGLSASKVGTEYGIYINVESDNYETFRVYATMELTSKENKTLTVTMADWIYGNAASAPSVSGLPEGVTATVTYTGRNSTTYSSEECPADAGDYSVSVRYESETAIYSGTADFALAKRTVTVGPRSYTITRGDAIPTFELEWSGVVAGDTLGLSITEASFSCYDGLTEVSASTAAGSYHINWLNAESADLTGDDAANYALIKRGTGTLTINVRSTGGGGDSSSTTTVTVPVSSDHASVTVKAEVSKGNATVSVSDQQIEKVAADGAGNVTLDASALKNVTSATVPSRVVEKTNEAEDTGLTVALPSGSVTLDETALGSVADNAKGKDVTISVEAVSVSELPTVVKKLIGMDASVVAVLDVNVIVGGAKQSNFDGGKITISIPYTPKKGEDTSKLTIWFVRDDGTIENKGGYYDADKKCFAFETDHLSQYLLVNTGEAAGFVDVPADAYYAEAVNWAVKQNITGGVDTTHFMPYSACTRAQIVTFLWRAAGCPEPKAMSAFSDVSADAYYAKAVAWAVENGITNGFADGTFGVDAPCTRAQAVAFLFRYAAANGMDFVTLQELISGYADADQVPGYALSAFNWALAGGIVTGNNGAALMPNSTCTRAQIVTFLYRLLGE